MPFLGTYKLEIWGAQGGCTQSAGRKAASDIWAEDGSFDQDGNYKIGSSDGKFLEDNTVNDHFVVEYFLGLSKIYVRFSQANQ